MPISELVRRVSHREFMAWLVWLNNDWNIPDKRDFYLMRIAHEVRYVLSEKRPHTLDEFKLRFDAPTEKRQQMTNEEKALFEKDKWAAAHEMATGQKRRQILQRQKEKRLARHSALADKRRR
jgi:hypothetical protein